VGRKPEKTHRAQSRLAHWRRRRNRTASRPTAGSAASNGRREQYRYAELPLHAWLIHLWHDYKLRHRKEFTILRRIFIGNLQEPSTYYLSRWLFLRGLGLIYFLAFVSLWSQIDGLIGSDGILPVKPYLEAVEASLGLSRFWRLPTLCWLSGSDAFLHVLCGGGTLLSMLLIAGICPIPVTILLWLAYLSLLSVSRVFLGYQWDILLLEVGFLSIFLAPGQILPRLSRERPPSLVVIWLHRFLLFRLMLSSGLVKLTSGDPTWRGLTAMNYHYETQPIPNAFAWYVHQLPEWFQKTSVLGVFAIELIVPFFALAPRRLRYIAFGGTLGFMLLIILTGNYCFFNLLAILLCVLLVDDIFLRRILRFSWFRRSPTAIPRLFSVQAMHFSAIALVAVVTVPLSLMQMKSRVFRFELSARSQKMIEWASPFRITSSYGLFASMTTSRPEIIIEGSDDGRNWQPYEFRWKAGYLKQRPRQVAPHQPRVDWQLWFEALRHGRDWRARPWFRRFLQCLLEGKSDVLALLKTNPFPDGPPKYIRAMVYDYRFTDFETRAKEGTWWRRAYSGVYIGQSSLGQR